MPKGENHVDAFQPARPVIFRKLTDARQICIRQMAGGKTTRLPGDRHVTRDLNISPAELVSLMFTSSDSIELLDKRIDCPNELTL